MCFAREGVRVGRKAARYARKGGRGGEGRKRAEEGLVEARGCLEQVRVSFHWGEEGEGGANEFVGEWTGEGFVPFSGGDEQCVRFLRWIRAGWLTGFSHAQRRQ